MERVFNVFKNYVDCCATCDIFLRGKCGYVDKRVSCEIVSDDFYFRMSEDELNEYGTQISHQPCERQVNGPRFIKDITELIDKIAMHEDENWIITTISKLYQLKNYVEQKNEVFVTTFKDIIQEAIMIIMSKIDFEMLKKGYDAGDILEMAGLGYERNSILCNICPRPFIDMYVKRATTFDERRLQLRDSNISDVNTDEESKKMLLVKEDTFDNKDAFTEIPDIFKTKYAPELLLYLNALTNSNYINSNYLWIKEGHTNYHAGIAAKIITKNVSGIKYSTISKIFGINNLADYASKATINNKVGVISSIVRCFKEAGLKHSYE